MNTRIQLLPAKFGDCFLVECFHSKVTRLLIDGGTAGTCKILERLIGDFPESDGGIDLCVVTHIDKDHIGGILKLLSREALPTRVKEIWFNGYRHLDTEQREALTFEQLSALQAEEFTKSLMRHKLPWNSYLHGGPIVASPKHFPSVDFDGIRVTILAPSQDRLRALAPEWIKEILSAGLVPGFGEQENSRDFESLGSDNSLPDVERLAKIPFNEDPSKANGSSIALLIEFGDCRMLFAGDAHPTDLVNALEVLYPGIQVELEVFKISHHASSGSTSHRLLEKVRSKYYIVSTNGAIYHHPDQETIARILKSNPSDKILVFNYATRYTKPWDSPILKKRYNYSTIYPNSDDEQVVSIDLKSKKR